MSAYQINPGGSGCQMIDSDRGRIIRELWHVTGLPIGTPLKFLDEPELPDKGSRHPNFTECLVKTRHLVEFWNVSSSEANAKVIVEWSSIAAWGAAINRNSRGGTRFVNIDIPNFKLIRSSPVPAVYDKIPTIIERAVSVRNERRNLGGFSVTTLERQMGLAIGHIYQLGSGDDPKYKFVGGNYSQTNGGSLIVDYIFELPQGIREFGIGSEIGNDILVPELPAGFSYSIRYYSNGTVSTIGVAPPFTPSGNAPNLPGI